MTTNPIQLLKPYQRAVFDDTHRFICWIAGRQIGKSFTGAMRVVRLAARRAKTDYMIASPSERQSLEAILKCKMHVDGFKEAKIAEEIIERDHKDALMKSDTIIFENGSRILAVPGKPDTVRGMTADIWMDEFAFFEDPDATWKAILPSISNPLKGLKTAFLSSTPNGKSGRGKRFYELVTNKGSIDPETAGGQYRAGEWSIHRTPITTAAPFLGTNVEELRRAVDDEEAWRQEFLCQFIDGSSVLLPYDLMAKCESMDATTDFSLFDWRHTNPLYVGIDFGRTSDPTVAWVLQLVGDVLWTRGVIVIRETNTVDQFAQLEKLLEKAAKVCIDYTGPGVGFGDMVEHKFGADRNTQLSKFFRNELCTFSRPFKCEIFPKLRVAMEQMKIRLPVDVECREDLHEMQQVITNGAYNYMAKRTAEGHSDRCTALALAVRAASFGGVGVAPFATGRGNNPDTRIVE